jgi:non-ribosomal peptide synthetase component F
MKGTWKNEQGGSYGPFSCTQSSTSHTTAALVCDSCKRIIPSLATRWNCTVCSPEWNCCSQCLELSSLTFPARVDPPPSLHPHTLEAEVVYTAEVAGGESCAQLVHNALHSFASRPLLGQRESASTSTFTWVTYGQVGEFVQDAAWGLRHLIGKGREDTTFGQGSTPAPVSGCIALCAENSPPYIAAMLACLLVGAVVVPIHPVLDTPSLLHVLAKTNPMVFFVGEEYVDTLKPSLASVSNVVVLPKKLTHTAGTNSRYSRTKNKKTKTKNQKLL